MDSAEKSLEAYDTLAQSIPSIGILSRKKRVIAYIKVTQIIQEMLEKQEVSEENALYLLSVLARKKKDFQKAAMMTALNLAKIDHKLIPSIGFTYANEMRCSIQLYPVDKNL